jgi:hypothetical protein
VASLHQELIHQFGDGVAVKAVGVRNAKCGERVDVFPKRKSGVVQEVWHTRRHCFPTGESMNPMRDFSYEYLFFSIVFIQEFKNSLIPSVDRARSASP